MMIGRAIRHRSLPTLLPLTFCNISWIFWRPNCWRLLGGRWPEGGALTRCAHGKKPIPAETGDERDAINAVVARYDDSGSQIIIARSR